MSNMTNVLEEFWYGNIEPSEYDTNSSKEYKEILQLISRNEDKLLATMTDEQKELFSRYTDCVREYQTDADIALVQNQLDVAIKLYKRAVFAEPKFAEAWNNLGNAYGMKSEYNNALAAFEKAIAIDPVYGKALYGKAVTLRNIGRLEDAMTIANAILEIYDVMEVRRFKMELVEAGVEDTQYLLENKKAIIALDNVGFKLMRDNNLLNDEGKITVIDGLYRPDEFTRSVLKYCKRKYSSLGEDKVRGEYIITSFYGSACATIFYSKDNQRNSLMPNILRNSWSKYKQAIGNISSMCATF